MEIFKDPSDVTSRLASLGLSLGVLETAVRRGHLARIECTENHPLTAPGFYSWSETVRVLRELLQPHDWVRDNDANQGLISNKALNIKLTVAGGDEATGISDRIPTTRSTKGPKMNAAVMMNGFLFGEMEQDYRELAANKSLWILLCFWNKRFQRIQCELSKPRTMDEKRPGEWFERIILPHIDTDFPHEGLKPTPGGPKTPEIVIEIKRRA